MTNDIKQQVAQTLYLCDKKTVFGDIEPFEKCSEYYLAQAQAALEVAGKYLEDLSQLYIEREMYSQASGIAFAATKLREAARSE